MFATEWIFTLFCSIIPIDQIDSIFTNFFRFSWKFLYKFLIHLLRNHEKAILEKNDMQDILSPIKDFKHKTDSNRLLSFFRFFGSYSKEVSWEKLIKESQSEVLDEKCLSKKIGLCNTESTT